MDVASKSFALLSQRDDETICSTLEKHHGWKVSSKKRKSFTHLNSNKIVAFPSDSKGWSRFPQWQGCFICQKRQKKFYALDLRRKRQQLPLSWSHFVTAVRRGPGLSYIYLIHLDSMTLTSNTETTLATTCNNYLVLVPCLKCEDRFHVPLPVDCQMPVQLYSTPGSGSTGSSKRVAGWDIGNLYIPLSPHGCSKYLKINQHNTWGNSFWQVGMPESMPSGWISGITLITL